MHNSAPAAWSCCAIPQAIERLFAIPVTKAFLSFRFSIGREFKDLRQRPLGCAYRRILKNGARKIGQRIENLQIRLCGWQRCSPLSPTSLPPTGEQKAPISPNHRSKLTKRWDNDDRERKDMFLGRYIRKSFKFPNSDRVDGLMYIHIQKNMPELSLVNLTL